MRTIAGRLKTPTDPLPVHSLQHSHFSMCPPSMCFFISWNEYSYILSYMSLTEFGVYDYSLIVSSCCEQNHEGPRGTARPVGRYIPVMHNARSGPCPVLQDIMGNQIQNGFPCGGDQHLVSWRYTIIRGVHRHRQPLWFWSSVSRKASPTGQDQMLPHN